MVVWIIGLSGTGKSTLAEETVRLVRDKLPNVALVDGDVIRSVFGDDLGHTLEDRRRNAERICRLCQFFETQGIHVVCAILSLFPETRQWNRQQLRSYYEVFVDTPIEELIARDSKGLYSRFQRGEIRDVAGMDLEFPAPDTADLVIANTGSRDELLAYAQPIAETILRSNA
jgi:adenylylsulfate kinase